MRDRLGASQGEAMGWRHGELGDGGACVGEVGAGVDACAQVCMDACAQIVCCVGVAHELN